MKFATWIAGLALAAAPMTLNAQADELFDGSAQSEAAVDGAQGSERLKVLGLGGFFFRADDPAALAAWYEKHLGINPVPTSYEVEPWNQEAGPTVFAPFRRSSEGMGAPGKEFVFNFRVADIEAFVAQLNADGIAVELDPQTYPNGRFASLSDPEGNPIQLWQAMDPGEVSASQ